MRSYIFDGRNGKPMSPDQYQDAQAALMAGGMPKDVGSGINMVAQALANRRRMGPFPGAPGGNTPQTILTGLFGLGGKGGLY